MFGLTCSTLDNGDIILQSIVNQLKQCGYPLENSIVSYYSPEIKAFLHCGFDPLPRHSYIPSNDYKLTKKVQVKFKDGFKSEYADDNDATANDPKDVAANKRTKERKIGFIIEKVSLWRKLYNGIQDGNGKTIRYSLEEAAHKVGVSKKSLDDYLSQLRKGRRYGFDFNKNKDDKVGTLRAWVKKYEVPGKKE